MKVGTEYYFYQNDHLGTPQKLTAVNGAVVWSAKYESFGKANIEVETVVNNLRSGGQYHDIETGLHYNWFRYYEPATGRYFTIDPIGVKGGINLFLYVAGNPVRNIDIDGLKIKCTKQQMLVTAYCSNGPGSDWKYYKPKKPGDKPSNVGPGTCAVANTKPPAYKYGCTMKVFDGKGSTFYICEVHDTGAGWDPKHHKVDSDKWIDIWIESCADARKVGKQWLEVEVCCEECSQ